MGLAAASCDLVERAEAHTLYEADYVRRSAKALSVHEAGWGGGAMRTVGTTVFGSTVAAVTSTTSGVGPGRLHSTTETQD